MGELSNKGLPGPFSLALTIIVHCLLLAPTVYILVLCGERSNNLFLWHPILVTIGCGLLMMEAVLAVSGEALLGSKVSRAGRVTIHWVLHALGVSLAFAGFWVVVANKVRNNANHFTSTHGILGLVTIIFAILTSLGGVAALKTRLFYPKVKPVLIKLVHAICGTSTTILILATLITGTYRGWWQGSELGRSLVFASYVAGGFFLLIKPIFNALAKIKFLTSPTPS